MKNNLYRYLWFDGNARESAEYYCSVFKDSEIKSDNQLVEIFESSGQKFMLLNGGPEFRINPLISLDIIYENTEGLDTAWEVLDPAKSKNLMDALLKMKKFEIAKLLVASRWNSSNPDSALFQLMGFNTLAPAELLKTNHKLPVCRQLYESIRDAEEIRPTIIWSIKKYWIIEHFSHMFA